MAFTETTAFHSPTLDEGETPREEDSTDSRLSSRCRGNKHRQMGKHCGNDGISVFLLSTHHIPHALQPYAPTASVSARLVEQCLWNYRDTLFLAREYVHTTEAENTQLRMHLLQLQQEAADGKRGTTDTPGSAASFPVEKQLWEIMLRDHGKHPLLPSESLRYQQILQDMKHLARGVLVPIEILRHRNHWLLLQEDVQLNLAGRLFHYRVVLRQSPPPMMVRRLWCDLWSLLGAAWRQRQRLMGAYAEGIPPVDLNGDVSQLPPASSTPLLLRDAHRAKQQVDAKSSFHREGGLARDARRAFGAERGGEGDDLAFGPLLPHRVGVTTSRHYAIRVPLFSFLSSLRVRVGEAAATTSTVRLNSSGRGKNAVPRSDSPTSQSSSPTHCAAFASASCAEDAALPNVPFFDTTVEEVEACRVPYLSPEWFVRLRSRAKGDLHGWDGTAVLHSYSDDAWNIAVLALEFMLTGFPLAKSCCGHPDSSDPPTSSLFDDVVKLLVTSHSVPLEAAQNFLYAALHELSLLLRQNTPDVLTMTSDDDGHAESAPLPRRLAQEWHSYLTRTYGGVDGDSTTMVHGGNGEGSIFRDIAESGLRWSRRDRWKAFQEAHALFLSDAVEGGSAAGERGGGGDDAGITVDAAQRVLGGLVSPLMPLHPTLCAAAARSGVGAETFMKNQPAMAPPPKLSSPSLWDVQTRLQVWRHNVEQHAMVEGGCRRDIEARRNVVFREFVYVVRRILQQRLRELRPDVEKKEEAAPIGPPRRSLFTKASFTNGGNLSQSAVQHGLLRGLIERGALFAYCTNECCAGDGTPPIPHGGGEGSQDEGEAEDDGSPPVFPFSQVFLPTEELLGLLHSDVVLLNSAFPAVGAVRSALDTIVGPQCAAKSRVSQPLSPAASKAGWLKSAKRVIREVDLSVAQQLAIIAELRCLLYSAPLERRALRMRRYLAEMRAAGASPYVPVPPTLRGEVWGVLLQVPPETARGATYCALNTSCISAFDRQLAVDIPRCHQYHPLLATTEGHERMRRVIKAWLLMNPGMAYWQGMDSVCAVLLAVSFTNEALVAAQLQQLTLHYIPHDAVASSPSGVQSMEERLHQFAVMLRYCDPRLAFHLLDEVECRPELFAISWFLALLAHGLPVGKVCLLWDFLFVYSEASPHCLTALCLAVLLQQRERLLGNDFSVCLSTLSRLRDIDVHLLLHDAALLLRSVPPALALLSLRAGEVRRCGILLVDVQTILRVFNSRLLRGAEDSAETAWAPSGLFLVDLRTHRETTTGLPQRGTRVEERVVGALLFPLVAPPAHNDDTSATQPSQRLVAQQATELLLQLDNMAMAALPPSSATAPEARPSTSAEELETETLAPPLPAVATGAEEPVDGPSTALRECAASPHVVLFTRSMTPCETTAAESLALELVRCGTPHVSILLGGFLELRQEAPHLVVEVEED
ncbi:putative GTPase activating protein [Trypanosoma rangeli]|uniref:Putative GTPase activating protein n=1 Tax=Trypanosoma rangeli TaxID=5698 RepID=A0A3R7NC88_TRYRA|nr:putative GTPase activating protein [Trypanosoma rangeli]RNF04179.1 putative GTPase activating protein [Trypanosoma rangeli]|eukprot:RNF04179.1 putative GTPase activating protein [Trypanosoma rangeli]